MRCEQCGSTNTEPGLINLEYLGNVVKGVPAVICLDCDERMILSNVLEQVSKLIKEGKTEYQ